MNSKEMRKGQNLVRSFSKCERGVGQLVKANKMKSKTNKQGKNNLKIFGSLNYKRVRGQEGLGGWSGPSSST